MGWGAEKIPGTDDLFLAQENDYVIFG